MIRCSLVVYLFRWSARIWRACQLYCRLREKLQHRSPRRVLCIVLRDKIFNRKGAQEAHAYTKCKGPYIPQISDNHSNKQNNGARSYDSKKMSGWRCQRNVWVAYHKWNQIHREHESRRGLPFSSATPPPPPPAMKSVRILTSISSFVLNSFKEMQSIEELSFSPPVTSGGENATSKIACASLEFY